MMCVAAGVLLAPFCVCLVYTCLTELKIHMCSIALSHKFHLQSTMMHDSETFKSNMFFLYNIVWL